MIGDIHSLPFKDFSVHLKHYPFLKFLLCAGTRLGGRVQKWLRSSLWGREKEQRAPHGVKVMELRGKKSRSGGCLQGTAEIDAQASVPVWWEVPGSTMG